MNLNSVVGNDKLVLNLKLAISTGKLHHGYIIEAPKHVDKLGFAKAFAKGILCSISPGVGCDNCSVCKRIDDENYLDITNIKATSKGNAKTKSVKVADIVNLIEALSKTPYEGSRNLAIIEDTNTMTIEALNKLLKTLEEPSVGTVIMLLTDNAQMLPNTITSRCVRLRLNEMANTLDLPYEKEAKELISLIIDNEYYYKISDLIDDLCKKKEDISALLDTMEITYRNLLFGKGEDHERFKADYVYKAVYCIEQAKKELMRNVRAEYALKRMAIEIGG